MNTLADYYLTKDILRSILPEVLVTSVQEIMSRFVPIAWGDVL